MSNTITSEILKVHAFFETSKLDKIGGIFKSKHFNAKEHILPEG